MYGKVVSSVGKSLMGIMSLCCFQYKKNNSFGKFRSVQNLQASKKLANFASKAKYLAYLLLLSRDTIAQAIHC